jgi:coenzyme Q-binding protein COQ10
MPSTAFTKHIRHAPGDLLALVSDVEEYPKFIDLISNLRITKQISETDFEAEAIVAYKAIRQTFKSLIQIDPDRRRIRVTKAERGGAVKKLENRWVFHELSDGTTLVDFYVDVTLAAFPLNILIRDKFAKASQDIMAMFEKRAGEVCPPIKTNSDLNLAMEKSRLGLA